MELFHSGANFNFVGRFRTFGGLSAVLIALSIGSFAVRGINFGIDFAGGYEIQVKFTEAVSERAVQEAIAPLGIGDARVQRFGAESDNEYLVLVRQHGSLDEAQKVALRQSIEALAGGPAGLTTWSVAESGESLHMAFTTPITESQLREALSARGLTVKEMTRGEREDQPEYQVELASLGDRIEQALRAGLKIPAEQSIVGRVEFVGPQVGKQLRNQGFLALLYSLVFMLLYIAVRFDLFFAPGAVVALVHDVIITMGVFSFFQFEFNLQVVAAILALIGYSINDTIVVYDRMRENVVRLRGRDLHSLVNSSINQTLSRTVLTSGTTLLTVIAMLVFAGGTIREFAIALFVGIIVGTYSSIGIAASLYVFLRERYQGKTLSGDRKVVAA